MQRFDVLLVDDRKSAVQAADLTRASYRLDISNSGMRRSADRNRHFRQGYGFRVLRVSLAPRNDKDKLGRQRHEIPNRLLRSAVCASSFNSACASLPLVTIAVR